MTTLPMKRDINRRQCASLALLPLLAVHGAASSQVFVDVITQRDLVAMKLKSDGITLDFPRLADTGASVPLSLAQCR